MTDDSKNSKSKDVRTVRCPHCGHPAVYSPENAFRPFCSERCRLIDLGQWADETYRVPAEESSSFTLNNEDEDEGA